MTDYIEEAGALLLLAEAGGDRNTQEIARRLDEMTPEELRLLREAIARIDDLIDEEVFERHLKRK